MVSIRLMRFGAKNKPSYRIVVVDSRKPRESKAKDYLGFYNPLKEPAEVKVDVARANMWLARGAKASPTVRSLLKKASQTKKSSS